MSEPTFREKAFFRTQRGLAVFPWCCHPQRCRRRYSHWKARADQKQERQEHCVLYSLYVSAKRICLLPNKKFAYFPHNRGNRSLSDNGKCFVQGIFWMKMQARQTGLILRGREISGAIQLSLSKEHVSGRLIPDNLSMLWIDNGLSRIFWTSQSCCHFKFYSCASSLRRAETQKLDKNALFTADTLTQTICTYRG